MMEELKKNELSETEMDSVAGGCMDFYYDMMEDVMREGAKQQSSIQIHDHGASGGW